MYDVSYLKIQAVTTDGSSYKTVHYEVIEYHSSHICVLTDPSSVCK